MYPRISGARMLFLVGSMLQSLRRKQVTKQTATTLGPLCKTSNSEADTADRPGTRYSAHRASCRQGTLQRFWVGP